MAVVARTRQRDHVLAGLGTLMEGCLAVGLPLASACSGQGACGRCLIRIQHGASALPPPDPREATRLLKLGAEADERLACQCPMPHPGADLVLTTGYW